MKIHHISWQETISRHHSVLWSTKPPEYCQIDGDQDALHFGTFRGDELVCVASVYFTSGKARLRIFATKAEYQNQGIGSKMLQFILFSLKCTDIKIFWCDARESALGFYQRFGMHHMESVFIKPMFRTLQWKSRYS